MDNLLSTSEVAKMLGIAASTLRGWRANDQGPRYARIGKKIKYHPDDVKRWWDTQIKLTQRSGV